MDAAALAMGKEASKRAEKYVFAFFVVASLLWPCHVSGTGTAAVCLYPVAVSCLSAARHDAVAQHVL